MSEQDQMQRDIDAAMARAAREIRELAWHHHEWVPEKYGGYKCRVCGLLRLPARIKRRVT